MGGRSNFSKTFSELTGNSPFPWQEDLYAQFISGAEGNIPACCDIPTGLGKTSVIAIWLIYHPNKMPRRLVYVVNRCTVVDQTTEEVKTLRDNLPKIDPWFSKLAISTLRGQFANNREWSSDPSRPVTKITRNSFSNLLKILLHTTNPTLGCSSLRSSMSNLLLDG